MTYGIEVYNSDGVKTMGMDDFTYSQIFETTLPQTSANYNVSVPGYTFANCIVMFSPVNYVTGEQPGYGSINGFVPGYTSPGDGIVTVLAYNSSGSPCAASRMQVFRIFGG